jgi:hypothetical protein
MSGASSVQNFGNAFHTKPTHQTGLSHAKLPTGAKPAAQHPAHHAKPHAAQHPAHHAAERKLTFTKIFRWRLPDGQKQEPAKVEIAGTFTNWQKVPLIHDKVRGGWHLTQHHVQGNRTHHYMLFADGEPVTDAHCDGMAIPTGAHEQLFAILTPRGPRVCMLFAQTK